MPRRARPSGTDPARPPLGGGPGVVGPERHPAQGQRDVAPVAHQDDDARLRPDPEQVLDVVHVVRRLVAPAPLAVHARRRPRTARRGRSAPRPRRRARRAPRGAGREAPTAGPSGGSTRAPSALPGAGRAGISTSVRNIDSGGTAASGPRSRISRSIVVPERSLPTMKNGAAISACPRPLPPRRRAVADVVDEAGGDRRGGEDVVAGDEQRARARSGRRRRRRRAGRACAASAARYSGRRPASTTAVASASTCRNGDA